MPIGEVAAAAIPAIGNLVSGLFSSGAQKRAEKRALRESQRQERSRAAEFARGYFPLEEFRQESEEYGRKYLEGGEETIGAYESRLSDLERLAGEGLTEKIRGIQSETRQGLLDVMPQLYTAGGAQGLSPFGGKTQRTIGGAYRTASEQADARIQAASFDFFDRLNQLNAQRYGLGEFRTGMGVGFRGEAGSLAESLFGARLQTPGAGAAIEAYNPKTGEFAQGSGFEKEQTLGTYGVKYAPGYGPESATRRPGRGLLGTLPSYNRARR